MIYHSGSDAGYRAYFARFPNLGYQFILFANASYINARKEAFKLISFYLKDTQSKNGSSTSSNKTFEYNQTKFIKLSNAEMKKFEGRYFEREEKSYKEVQLKNDTLYFISEGDKNYKLLPVGKSNFKLLGTPL